MSVEAPGHPKGEEPEAAAPSATELSSPSDEGRIPFALRVGVTGHRFIAERSALAEGVAAVLAGHVASLFPPSRETPVVFTAISALAEGADRVVAEQILATHRGSLEVVLPLDEDDYRRDFEDDESRARFDQLKEQASSTTRPFRQSHRPEAYAAVGRAVVDRSDILMAVWDGEPARGAGGTAETVAYALSQRVPVVMLRPDGRLVATDLGDGDVDDPAFSGCGVQSRATRSDDEAASRALPIDVTRAAKAYLEHYNQNRVAQSRLRSRRFEQAIVEETSYLPMDGLGAFGRQNVVGWILPYFVRADRMALGYQRRYYWFIAVEFVASALAILTVASVNEFGHTSRWVGLEVLFLAIVVAVVVLGRHWKLNRWWLSSRFLAEQFRSAPFLKVVGLGAARNTDAGSPGLADPAEQWIERAHAYVWNAWPKLDAPRDREALSKFLVGGWINPQILYHNRQAARQGRRAKMMTVLSITLFVVTAAVAVVHVSKVGEGLEHWEVLVAIALPAFGSAVAGIAGHHQYLRSSSGHRDMARRLIGVRANMAAAQRLGELQRLADDAAVIMTNEAREWLGMMKFTDFEISG